ncbi:hypothetical protein CQ018_03150 [Arthrobacter sp. MYb227]|uniref:hypothetical protein n=1 Tax=Arthrobacter sp. MYb227 TaxID=1848601 RepID=UPI000CFDF326|nr:hypothetical protein [Arthrobacter sp. MYb227]PQZ96280.1 hypothetical protein CQ018_03150 [Arthrobacter sp. MYb227]
MQAKNIKKVVLRVSAAIAVPLVGLSLSGCGAQEKANVILSTSQAGYSAVVSTEANTGTAMAAQLSGPLVLGSGGCFEVMDSTGKETWAVFPVGSTVIDGQIPALKVGEKTYNVGDTVNFGGGFGQLNEESLKVAGTCALESEPFFIHSTTH